LASCGKTLPLRGNIGSRLPHGRKKRQIKARWRKPPGSQIGLSN